MKKLFGILLSVAFLFSTIGFTIVTHYCGGEKTDTGFSMTVENCCDNSDDCCQNEQITFQLKDEARIISILIFESSSDLDIVEFPTLLEISSINNSISYSGISHNKKILDNKVYLADIQSFLL